MATELLFGIQTHSIRHAEADEMLSKIFLSQIHEIFQYLPGNIQPSHATIFPRSPLI